MASRTLAWATYYDDTVGPVVVTVHTNQLDAALKALELNDTGINHKVVPLGNGDDVMDAILAAKDNTKPATKQTQPRVAGNVQLGLAHAGVDKNPPPPSANPSGSSAGAGGRKKPAPPTPADDTRGTDA